MRRILHLGHTDLRMFLKHKGSWIWLFLVPLAFVYFMGFAARGPGRPWNYTAPVLIENSDTNFMGRILMDELGAQKMWLLSPTNTEPAARTIRIPAEFTDNVVSLRETKLGLVERDSAEADTVLIEARLIRGLVALNSHLLEAAASTNGGGRISEAALREAMARPDPVTLDSRFAGRKPVPTGFNFSLPGNMVMYVMMNLLIFGGVTLAAERRRGVVRRMMSQPVRRTELVMGKIYGLMLLGAVQIAVFLLLGKFVFKVNLGWNLPAVGLTLLVFAWVAASLGVLIGSITVLEDRVTGFCVLAALIMAAVGGCWWPLEIGSPALQTAALYTPTGWALKALHQLISFGSGFESVLLPLGVLAGIGAAANLAAAKFFRC